MEIFVKCLENCSNLESVNLQGNSLGENSAEKISAVLQNSETIKYLNFENNNIGTNGIIVSIIIMIVNYKKFVIL